MKYLLVLLVFLAGCNPPPDADKEYAAPETYLVANDTLILCESKSNIPNKLLYQKSKQVLNNIDVPENVSFKSYYITDVLGRVYSINSDEIPNYKCFEVVSNK